jgi:hypothetical protein
MIADRGGAGLGMDVEMSSKKVDQMQSIKFLAVS